VSIIITKKGKGAQKLDRTAVPEESYLQNYICENPESLPLDEVSEDIHLLVVAREFPTASGPIDALGFDQEGNIYVIRGSSCRSSTGTPKVCSE
jgi:RecB family endonuclease NucS